MEASRLFKNKGILFIVSAPSGAGKTSLIRALTADDNSIKMSVSYTTRPARTNEASGAAYHFVDDARFLAMAEQGFFLEHAQVFGHRYGTARTWVEEQLGQGFNVILEIDWQGAKQIRSVFDGVVSVFVLPPTHAALYERLSYRKEQPEVIRRRMQDAQNELTHYCEYDFIVINDDFDVALSELRSIIKAIGLSRRHQSAFYHAFVASLVAQDS